MHASDTIAAHMAVQEQKQQASTSVQQTGSAGPTWWPLAVLVAINILNFYDRQVAGAVVEPVRKEFSLSDTQIGLLNTAFTVLYGIVGVPLGRLADRVSRKKLLALGVTVWAMFTASSRWIQSYWF